MDRLLRHVLACNSARLPGERRPLRIGQAVVGYVRPDIAAALVRFPEIRADAAGLTLTEPAALPYIARALAAAGAFRWRGEAFDVRATADGEAFTRIDRGALPVFGMMSIGVHVNGLVRAPEGWSLWVGYRAPTKHLDPNKLDHVVAGGVPAGMTPEATLVKEASEEAAIPPEVARRAVRVGRIAYAMEREEGLRRDLLFCYDLELPPNIVPRPNDGEVARFELWPLPRVLAAARDSDAFKFNVNLVLIDLFLRYGLITGEAAATLRTALNTPAVGAPQ